jgi:alkylation response protein AidB-like acyl-CoA dehydrogenase
MPDENFYLDNDDIRFNLTHMVDLESIAELKEDLGSPDCAYESAGEVVEAYLDLLEDPIGALAAQRIAPRAAEVDKQGCHFEAGKVTLPEPAQLNVQDLAEADLMGMTLPTRYGGLNFPAIIYAAATEMISRGDASLMNLFGLQGIAETINLFASDELKDKYLPGFCSGAHSGAMVLTEPDAGSDLTAVQTRAAYEDDHEHFHLTGTKRFITNGCGEVLLVLARSEDPEKYGGGRGLSLFLVEKDDTVTVRRIEEKLGIHGSPTCEIYFNNSEGHLIGQRGRGLTRYVNWLMNAARLGVAAQSVGISEAAFAEAREYARQREQFGQPIDRFPAVREMLVRMRLDIEASRALMYATAEAVDMELLLTEKLEALERKDPRYADLRARRDRFSKAAEVLTPLAKYYTSEKSISVTTDAVQVHGGNGYMKEYAVERLYRDARITSIYEGTSQIQIDRAIPRVMAGAFEALLDDFADRDYGSAALNGLREALAEARRSLQAVVAYVNDQKLPDDQRDTDYRNLTARMVCDMALDTYLSYLFLEQARHSERKATVAAKFIQDMAPRVEMNRQYVMSGDRSVLQQFEILTGGHN